MVESVWTWINTSPLGSAIAAGLVVLFIGWLASIVYKRAKGQSLWPRLWLGLRNAAKWTAGIRVSTARGRMSLDAEGYNRRVSELEVERDRAPQPAWRFDTKSSFGMSDAIFLTNHGYQVFDVEVTWDDAAFTALGEVFFPGSFSTNTGKWFQGTPTASGLSDGVTFHVAWRDKMGNEYERDVLMPSDDLRAGPERLLKERHSEGAKEGYQRGLQDHAESVLLSVPPPMPRWSIHWGPGSWSTEGGLMEVVVRNAMPESTAHGVRIDSMDSNTSVADAGYWQQMHGEGNRTCTVRVHAGGVTQECRFRLTWRDHNGDEMAEPMLLPGLENQNLPRATALSAEELRPEGPN